MCAVKYLYIFNVILCICDCLLSSILHVYDAQCTKNTSIQFPDNMGPLACIQADQDFCCLLTESINIVVYVDKQTMPRSDCMVVHADLDLPIHMI